ASLVRADARAAVPVEGIAVVAFLARIDVLVAAGQVARATGTAGAARAAGTARAAGPAGATVVAPAASAAAVAVAAACRESSAAGQNQCREKVPHTMLPSGARPRAPGYKRPTYEQGPTV